MKEKITNILATSIVTFVSCIVAIYSLVLIGHHLHFLKIQEINQTSKFNSQLSNLNEVLRYPASNSLKVIAIKKHQSEYVFWNDYSRLCDKAINNLLK